MFAMLARLNIFRLNIFVLELFAGILTIGVALLLLWFLSPMDPRLEKGIIAFLTVGGTVCLSGVFRMGFANKVDNVQQNIIDTISAGIREFQPTAITRVDAAARKYEYLYWRSIDIDNKTPAWRRFRQLKWNSQVHPFETAETGIAGKDNQEFLCTMVQLPGCFVVFATRRDNQQEMAGLNFFERPLEDATYLFGHVRHQTMRRLQALSSCILSKEELHKENGRNLDAGKLDEKLDAMWAEHSHAVILNLGRLSLEDLNPQESRRFLKADVTGLIGKLRPAAEPAM